MTGATTSGSTSSAATQGTTDDPTGGGSNTGTATTGTSDPTSTSGTSGPVDETSTGAPVCDDTPTRSDDLKGLVCDGEVVQVCDDGAYCIDGACAPLEPCEAAALLKGCEGCDFWALKTEISLPGSCFAAFIANKTAPRLAEEPTYRKLPRLTGTYRKPGNGLATTRRPARVSAPDGEWLRASGVEPAHLPLHQSFPQDSATATCRRPYVAGVWNGSTCG
jgi:hypothetical protein